MSKITPFLWFDTQAEEAARFYVSLIPNSRIVSVNGLPVDLPHTGAKAGDVITVAFELDGQPYTAMNGGPGHPFTDAISLVIDCDGQDEVDRYWSALTANGGQEVACGWLKDRYGLSWQVTPRQLIEMTTGPDKAAAARAFQAMMGMVKIDVAGLKAAYEGR
ncbi:VOC family protein [Caulobacter sp.]|uniref:VOC family protein n=1 Tax=Caulobacter sp. TaxID=78 RepID=UPI002B458E5E|nr:VOC family protein [Caulobacter sp.]HJV41659.1 VOC family protein [Caulobacter sp.]